MIPANRFRRLRRLLPGSALLTLALGAPPSGTELQVGAETGAYHYVGGCDGPHNYESYVAMQIRARHRTRDGWVVAGEGAGQLSRVTDSAASPSSSASQVGLRHELSVLALRVGYEGRYGGFEVGPAAGYFPSQGSRSHGGVLPSFKLWLGRYGAVHAWGAFLADQTISLNRLAGAGLGHHSERVKASLGVAISAGNDASVIADADVAVAQNLWLGVGAQIGETRHTWGGMLRVGFFFDAPAAPAVARPASEATPPPVAAPPPPSPAVEQPEPVVTPDVQVADAGVPLPGERDKP